MRTKARSPRIPRKLLRGQKLLDGISGEEIYQRDATTRYQRGMYMHVKNYDYLTTAQMEEMLQTQVSGGNIDFLQGQGTESPSYVNLPYFADDQRAIAAGYVIGMPYNGPSGFTHVGDVPGNVYDDASHLVKDDAGNYLTT